MVVVDNNSEKKNVLELSEIEVDNRVKVIYEKDNLGYFGGLNVGIKWVRDRQSILKFDLWLVGNNDLLVTDQFLDSVKSTSDIFNMYPVVSPDIMTLDGIHQNPHVIHKISPFREFVYTIYHGSYWLSVFIHYIAKVTKKYSDRKDELQHEYAQEICQGYGACYFLTECFFKNYNYLCNYSFMMHEELFLSIQLSEKGYKVYYEPRIKIIHSCKGATSLVPNKVIWGYSRRAHRIYRKYVNIFGTRRRRRII